MLRVALSIRAGRLLPSAILRRLATYSRKNRLYFAFRELGRAVRTDFLLRYLSSVELRRADQAATNKSELFNRYAQWVSFGSSGLATAAERDEQRKMVKYNHLVANLLIFHTAVGMTHALDAIAADGHGAAISPEALAGTQPLPDRAPQPLRQTTCSTSASRPRRCPSSSRRGHGRRRQAAALPRQSLCEVLARIVAIAHVPTLRLVGEPVMQAFDEASEHGLTRRHGPHPEALLFFPRRGGRASLTEVSRLGRIAAGRRSGPS